MTLIEFSQSNSITVDVKYKIKVLLQTFSIWIENNEIIVVKLDSGS